MNRIDFIKFKEAIIMEFRLLRQRLSHGETTIKVDFHGTPVILISVSEFSPCKCDPCFNQLICELRGMVRTYPGTRFVNQCLFYREEPTELMKLSVEPGLRMMEGSYEKK